LSSALRQHPFLVGLFFGSVVCFIAILCVAVVRVKRRSGGADAPPPAIAPRLFGTRAPDVGRADSGLYNPLEQTALSGGNQLAQGLAVPERPKEVAAFLEPGDRGTGDTLDVAVETVVRGRRMHVIDVTGWGVVPPQGFALDPSLHNTWKPASGNPADSRVFIQSGPACTPSCAGQPVDDAALTRGIIASRRSYTFHCPWVVQYAGMEWKYAYFAVIKLGAETCVTMVLLSRTPQVHQQRADAFFHMRDSLQPLPRRPEDPTFEETAQDGGVQLSP
jgi:hypothetical protein